jgi:hypothetical protein
MSTCRSDRSDRFRACGCGNLVPFASVTAAMCERFSRRLGCWGSPSFEIVPRLVEVEGVVVSSGTLP